MQARTLEFNIERGNFLQFKSFHSICCDTQKLLINLESAKYPISVIWMFSNTLLYLFVIRVTWHYLKNDEIKKSLISLIIKKIFLWISLVTLILLRQFLHPRSTLHTHYGLTVHKSIMELIRYCFLDQKYTFFSTKEI